MKRPSRGEVRSATTTRQTGSFRPPTRVRRMLTDIRRSRVAAPSAPQHLPHVRWHLARREALHDLAHLLEVLHELVDLLDRGARALGDAQAPRALDDVRAAALPRGHGEDDGLDPVELLVVDLQALQ